MRKYKKSAQDSAVLKTKVLIVGGGPAGATAARYLAEAGIDTILAERDFAYTKPCAGGISIRRFREFGLPENLIKKRIDRVTIVSPSDQKIELQQDLYITDRYLLNQTMRSIASGKGASLIEAQFVGFGEHKGAATTSLLKRKEDGGIVEIKSEYVLACDGISFSVGRKCGIKKHPRVYTISVQMNSFHGDVCEFWLGSGHAAKFYSWVFPSSDGASIGTGGENPYELQSMLDVFMKRRFGNSIKQLRDENIIGRTKVFPIPIWTGNIYRSGNILFLGDAAGMVMPVTGEGIYYAMKAGQFAAQAIIDKSPDLYQQFWERKFKRRFTEMSEIGSHVFKNDETIEKYIDFYRSSHNGEIGVARKPLPDHEEQEKNIQSNKRKVQQQESLAKDNGRKALEATVADARQVRGVFVFALRQLEDPQMLFQQIFNEQRARGFKIASDTLTKVGVVKDVNDRELIRALLFQEFPVVDIKELFANTAVQAFRLPDGNEVRYCIVYDLMPGKTENSADTKMRPFNNMMLILTEGCNLRCSYCYENSKAYSSKNKMTWDTAKKAVDFFFAQVPEKMDRTSITFFGGEPVLAFDLIKKVVDYSYPHRTIKDYTGDQYNYVVITNGTILTDEMFELYSRLGNKLNIRISVDGYKDNQDITRKTAEGKGSWLMLEKTLPRFRDLKEKHGVKINIISTLNKSTCRDIYYNYIKLYELTGIQIASVLIHEDKWENEDYQAIKEQVMLLHDYCLQNKVMFHLCNTQMDPNSAYNNNEGMFQSICSAGISSFTVNHTGDIYSCHRAYYYGLGDIFELGNIETGFNNSARELLYEVNNLKKLPLKCQECLPGIRRKCRLCTASNKKAYGDFYNIPDGYCALMKEVHNLLLEREAKKAGAKSNKKKSQQKETITGNINPTAQKTSTTNGKQVNGVLIFSSKPVSEPQTLWQRIIDGERARGVSIAPNVITKIGTVKDVNDKALITAVVRQSFPDGEIKELMERTIVQSFRLPDGNSGKCCIVFNRP